MSEREAPLMTLRVSRDGGQARGPPLPQQGQSEALSVFRVATVRVPTMHARAAPLIAIYPDAVGARSGLRIPQYS